MKNQEVNKLVSESKEGAIPKWKSPGFWIGIGGVVLASAGVQLADLSSWAELGNVALAIVSSPATLIGIGMALYGSWNNPTRTGIN